MGDQKKVGGTKRVVLEGLGLTAIGIMFLVYMVPFVLILLNSFKQKRDIITNPFSLYAKKGYSLENYIEAFDKMDFVKAFGNSFLITGLSTVIVILLASMVAYYFTRSKNLFSYFLNFVSLNFSYPLIKSAIFFMLNPFYEMIIVQENG